MACFQLSLICWGFVGVTQIASALLGLGTWKWLSPRNGVTLGMSWMAMLRLMQSMPFWGINIFPLTYYCVHQLSLLLPGLLILSTTYVVVLVLAPHAPSSTIIIHALATPGVDSVSQPGGTYPGETRDMNSPRRNPLKRRCSSVACMDRHEGKKTLLPSQALLKASPWGGIATTLRTS